MLRIALPVLATVAIVAPLAWLWQASRVPSRYSVMEMGYHDYGGGAMPDTDAGGHGSHGQGNGNGHHQGRRGWSPTWWQTRHDQLMYVSSW